jgi:DeoR/GlpR family transcriptional regulator of sugar metabolism
MHVVLARRERLAQLLEQHRYLPVQELCRRLGVSEATARRDLAALVGEKKITRTYGGALHEFNDRFPSFRERQGHGAKAKRKIAQAALAIFEPNRTYFFDSGTTICAVAEAFRDHPVTPVTVVTSNLPVGEMLASIPGVQVFQLAGQLLHLQSTLLGETAQKSLEFWNFDVAFLSAEGMDARGIWNSQAAIVELQSVVLRRTGRNVFCIDGSKLKRQAPHFLTGWEAVDTLLTDVPNAKLISAGINLAASKRAAAAGRGVSATIASAADAPDDADSSGDFPVHIL